MGISKIRKIRTFFIKFSKVQAKKLRLERVLLEKKLKNVKINVFNSQIQIGNKIVIVSSFSERNINFVGQLFKTSTSRRVWSIKQRKV